MRAVIYSRFSSEKQSETSIDDQERVCRARAARDGFEVTEVFADQGVSGSTPLAARPGGRGLLAAMLAKRFDVLIVEGLDRVSRDQVECEQTCRRFEHRQLRIIGVSDGYDSASASRKIQRGVRGLINEIYLDDLRAKTHRGLSGQVSRGFHAGGLSFGYRSVAVDGGHHLAVDERQAETVRLIFERFAAGDSCQVIARTLNERGIPSPRGGTWVVSGIYGCPRKGSGIINNELYVGRYVWNRGQFVKDPETQRRQRVDRPRSEWQIEEKPELRIVDEMLWQAVQARLHRTRALGGSKGKGAKPRVLLGGLMRCGCCGGAVVAVSATAYGCAARKDRGAVVCKGVRVKRVDAEAAVLGYVRDELMSPAAVKAFEAGVRDYLAEIRRGSRNDDGKRKSQVVELEREVERLTDAIAQIGYSSAIADRLKRAELELKAARATSVPAPAADIIPDAVKRFRDVVLRLEATLATDIDRAREMLRDILGQVVITNDEAGVAWGEIEGFGTALLAGAATGTDGNRFWEGLRGRDSLPRIRLTAPK